MAIVRRKSHFLVALVAAFIHAIKRDVFAATITGAPPTAAVADAATGTGYATAAQVVTTTENFTAALNQFAGCWFLAATKAPCLIVSHPAVTGAPLVLTVQGAAPATTAEGFRILRGPTPSGALTAPIHFDRAEYAVTAANASSLETARTLLGAVVTAYLTHAADALAHLAPDAANVPTETIQEILAGLPAATLGDLQDLANNMKAAFTAHRTEAGVHAVDDAGHAIAAADATDQSSLNTLLNELKADLNLHMADGLATPSWRAVDV